MRVGVIGVILFFNALGFGATSLSPSVLMFSLEDTQNCSQQIDRALSNGERRLLFLPTLYFVANDNTDHLRRYCSWENGKCIPFDNGKISEYVNVWQACFTKAIKNGLAISILPHIDDGGEGHSEWRNEVVFDPLKKYGGYSYDEILLKPLVKALELASQGLISPSIDMSLQGEMGATVFTFPKSYFHIFTDLKKQHPQWKVGLSFNHNDVDGKVGNPNPTGTNLLFSTVDFIGISAYHSVHIPVLPHDFEQTLIDFKNQLTDLAVTLPPNKIFQFSEVGLGGGRKEGDGLGPAATPEENAATPWAGVKTLPYRADKDPWQNPAMKTFRAQFYKALLDFLSQDLSQSHVSAAYTWNILSWDVEGLVSPEYGDYDISNMIRQHNRSLP